RLSYRAPVPYTLGLTGAPGSGKSTLTDRLITLARSGWPDPPEPIDQVRVLGAAGLTMVIVETVGVGQMEVVVASAADTTVVVVTPGWGDSMQANKAGLLEIADLFVINKADRPGAREARRDLEQMLDLSTLGAWRPPVIDTIAATGEGVAELWSEIARHRAHLLDNGLLE